MSDVVEMPWPFVDGSDDPADEGRGFSRNVPTELGRAAGRELARFADEAAARHGADVYPRCHDCAFRLGTDPNGCESTVMTAIKCAAERETFYCHVRRPEGGPPVLCAGWIAMVVTPPATPWEPPL